MSTVSEPKRCPKCGGPISAEAPQGLCPKCLSSRPRYRRKLERENHPCRSRPRAQKSAAAFPQLEILELIGQGGMGFVYKARQPKLDRFVALKILPQSLAADPAFAERFTREGRVLARLNHPNIVTDPRLRPGGRLLLSADGICGRREPAPGDEGGPVHARAGAGDRAEDLRGAPVRAQRRHPAPRHQAGEHPARHEGPREDRRLRHRQAGRGGEALSAKPGAASAGPVI